MPKKFVPKEVSWLYFNGRVLQEAADPTVPLIDRIKFLGIYSSNLDEFFEVRVATLKRLSRLKKDDIKMLEQSPDSVLDKIEEIVIEQRHQFNNIYEEILKELEKKNVFIIDEKEIRSEHIEFIHNYFVHEIRPHIFPIRIDKKTDVIDIKEKSIYLAVIMKSLGGKIHHYLIQIPAEIIPRFVELPKIDAKKYIIMIDDIIRYELKEIFSVFDYSEFEAYEFKMNRDAELDIDDDIMESYITKVNKGLKKRKLGEPVRFSHDSQFPDELLKFILNKLSLEEDDSVIPTGRYQNSRDFMKFPDILGERKQIRETVPHRALAGQKSILSVMRNRDFLMHFPFHPFHYMIDLIREAALDPNVISIKMTLYRLAKFSSVINALINAKKNGKEVTVVLELQARFDEEANIFWANRLEEEGIQVIFGVQGLKVHSKLCLICREEKEEKKKKHVRNYCIIGTGNFNEFTAQIYTDDFLFTADKRLCDEVKQLFDFFESYYKLGKFKHLIVSPFSLRDRIEKMINTEIRNAKEGNEAYIFLKINNLADPDIIKRLYKASNAGVRIRIIGRGMFSLIPGIKGLSENIEAISIVDKYLEHSRYFIFCNAGNPKYFITSADWLQRNFDRRIEVTCPILDAGLQKEMMEIFTIAWNDNVKARIHGKKFDNQYRPRDEKLSVRSQDEIYHYLLKLHALPEETTHAGENRPEQKNFQG